MADIRVKERPLVVVHVNVHVDVLVHVADVRVGKRHVPVGSALRRHGLDGRLRRRGELTGGVVLFGPGAHRPLRQVVEEGDDGPIVVSGGGCWQRLGVHNHCRCEIIAAMYREAQPTNPWSTTLGRALAVFWESPWDSDTFF